MLGSIYACGDCPYLANKTFQVFVPSDDMRPHYRLLMDHGFRRNGETIYHTHCDDCNACEATRVAIPVFKMRKDQKRCWNRNQDLVISVAAISQDQEHRDLFARYEAAIHQHDEADLANLCDDWRKPRTTDFPVEQTDRVDEPIQEILEIQARTQDGTLVAVSLIDVFEDAVSSVYCYYDPAHKSRALGTFMVLQEIDFCRQHGLEWLYLGFYVTECQKLAYKARFQPLQIYRQEQWQWV